MTERLTLLVTLLALAQPVKATMVRRLSLDEMAGLAERVVVGRCVDVRAVSDAPVRLPVVEVTVAVDETIKGMQSSEITFRTIAARSLGAGLPPFKIGESMVLFLHGTGPLGLTSPVGLSQGYARVQRRPDGRSFALAAAGSPLVAGAARSVRTQGPLPSLTLTVPLDEMLRRVREAVRRATP